jgi:hypothetical protein
MKVYFLALGTLVIVCVGCAHDMAHVAHKDEYHAPPAAMLAHPGPMVGGPGPGVMSIPPSALAAMPVGPGCPPGMMGMGMPIAPRSTQVKFLGPEGMAIGWQIGGAFAESQITAPGRYNFFQGATYRLKLVGVPGREGLVLYPSLHVYPEHPTTAAYLAHNAIPVRVTDEDLDQIETNNFVTKVIYLPDAKYQELAIAGVEELVSTRLAPGQDPIQEADRRGTIMAVVRIGNLDLEMPGAPGGLAQNGGEGQMELVDGELGQFQPPMPIGDYRAFGGGVPGDMMMGGPAGPGCPPYNPIAGVGGVPMYGMPVTGTPIGLPGPPHIPLGRPAGLRSHTVRNLTSYDVGEPVKDMLIDVKHDPGIRLPHPVNHIQYTETHPVYRQDELSQPANGGGPGGAYCPPGQYPQ